MARSTLRSCTPSGTVSTAGAKFKMAPTPASTSRSATSWAADAGVAMIPITTSWRAHQIGQPVEGLHREIAHQGAHLGRIGVDEGRHPVAPGPEAPIVGEGPPEVPQPHDDHRPVLGEAQLASDLVQELLDVVPHAPGSIGTQIREVLAHLGRVDAGQLGQPVGGDGGDLALGGLEQRRG